MVLPKINVLEDWRNFGNPQKIISELLKLWVALFLFHPQVYSQNILKISQILASIFLCSQLPPCGHLAITDTPLFTDSSKIPGESYRCLTEINFRYYGLLLLQTYGHFIRSQRHNFIVFSLVIADTEQHLGIFAHISSLFFQLFETVFVSVLIDFLFFCPSIKIP